MSGLDISFHPAACAANHYLDPSSPAGLPICIPCPSNSVSGGGNAVSCTCNSGTGRVDESDVTLPCLGKYIKINSI